MSKSLPPKPNLEQLKKQAKSLLASFHNNDATAASLFNQHLPLPKDKIQLSDSQLVLAREYGFSSWAKLKAHVEIFSADQQTLDDAMIRAANKQKDLMRVQELLDAGANINGRLGGVGSSALFWAACGGRTAVMQFLIERGADANAPGNYGTSALSGAALLGQLEAVRLLLQNGANPNPVEPQEYSVMLCATFGANEGIVRVLIDAGSEVNVQAGEGVAGNGWFNFPYCGETPLHNAMAYGSRGMIQALLDAGADPTAKTKHGETPFHWAGRHQRPKELMRWLRSLDAATAMRY